MKWTSVFLRETVLSLPCAYLPAGNAVNSRFSEFWLIVWGRAWDSAFLPLSSMMLTLLGQGLHWEGVGDATSLLYPDSNISIWKWGGGFARFVFFLTHLLSKNVLIIYMFIFIYISLKHFWVVYWLLTLNKFPAYFTYIAKNGSYIFRRELYDSVILEFTFLKLLLRIRDIKALIGLYS